MYRLVSNLGWRVRHGVAKRLFGLQPPSFASFAAPLDQTITSHYPGQVAKLFFENEGDVAHKWLHYLPIYDQLLSTYVGAKIRMLEIGVSLGGSLTIWRKFLGPDANLFGIDINPDCAVFDGKSGSVRIGSQADPNFLRHVVKEMGGLDVVLDDGSHVASHQRISFETLFPLLSEGGLYIIEDMQTAYWGHFEGGWKRKGTAIEFLKDKIDAMHRHYVVRGQNRSDAIPEIESIQFFDSIAAVRKKRQLPRASVMTPQRPSGVHYTNPR